MRTLVLAISLLAASPLAWAQDGKPAEDASVPAEDAPEGEPVEEEEAGADETAAEPVEDDASPEADEGRDGDAVPEAEPDSEVEPDSTEGTVDESASQPEPEAEVEANGTTAVSSPAPVAHGTDVPTPADRVGKKPNKPLLYAAGGLAAATAATYGIAYSSYSRAFNADTPPYEDFEQIRQRTNTLTVVTGGLAAATIGTGVTAFIVGEF